MIEIMDMIQDEELFKEFPEYIRTVIWERVSNSNPGAKIIDNELDIIQELKIFERKILKNRFKNPDISM